MLRLEENLEKLRQTLRYWQTAEAEYEALKEEVMDCGQPLDGVGAVCELTSLHERGIHMY